MRIMRNTLDAVGFAVKLSYAESKVMVKAGSEQQTVFWKLPVKCISKLIKRHDIAFLQFVCVVNWEIGGNTVNKLLR